MWLADILTLFTLVIYGTMYLYIFLPLGDVIPLRYASLAMTAFALLVFFGPLLLNYLTLSLYNILDRSKAKRNGKLDYLKMFISSALVSFTTLAILLVIRSGLLLTFPSRYEGVSLVPPIYTGSYFLLSVILMFILKLVRNFSFFMKFFGFLNENLKTMRTKSYRGFATAYAKFNVIAQIVATPLFVFFFFLMRYLFPEISAIFDERGFPLTPFMSTTPGFLESMLMVPFVLYFLSLMLCVENFKNQKGATGL